MSRLSYLRPWVYDETTLLAEQFSYGHREVLLKSLNKDNTSLFMGSVPHGWGPYQKNRPYPMIRRRNFAPYPVLAWSEREYYSLKSLGHQKPIMFGSPWAHFVSKITSMHNLNLASSSSIVEKKILFFPSHSIPGSTVDHTITINEIRRLSGIDNVTVSLFWLDFVNPEIKRFYELQRCEVICNGFKGTTGFDSPWTPAGGRVAFLPQLFERIVQHQLIVVDTVSTPFWYSASLGKDLMIYGSGDTSNWWYANEVEKVRIENSEMLSLADPDLVHLPFNEVIQGNSKLVDVAKAEMGFELISDSEKHIENYNLLKTNMVSSDVSRQIDDYFQKKSTAASSR